MKTLKKLKALCTYWVVIYGPKISQFLVIIFFIRIGYTLLNFYYLSFVMILYEYCFIIPESEVLGTSPTSGESDLEKPKNPESRDSMVEKDKKNRDDNFREFSKHGNSSGIGYGTYQGTNLEGKPCEAFNVNLKAFGFELYQHDNVSCGDSADEVQTRLHDGVQAGLEEKATKPLITQNINETRKDNLDSSKKK